VPPGSQPVSRAQQRKPVIQPIQQLRHAKRLHPRRGQLDGQRHAVKARHQPRRRRSRRIVQHEPRIYLAGAVREQGHRFGSDAWVTGQGQRSQPVARLTGNSQRLPAGDQHPQVVTGSEQGGAELGSRVDDVLAVIQHQQQLLPGQHPGQHIGWRDSRLLAHSQGYGHHRRDLRRILYRRQLGRPRPVGEPARHPPGYLGGQPGLAHPARPGQRHQPVPLQQARDLAHRPVPADEARQRGRETMRATGHGGRHGLPHADTLTASRNGRTAPAGQAGLRRTQRTPGRYRHRQPIQAWRLRIRRARGSTLDAPHPEPDRRRLRRRNQGNLRAVATS
jgi:hypothetical protein